MAKLDDLNLGDSGPPASDDLAKSRVRFQRFYNEVMRLMEDGEHDFAWGYLKSLSLTLEKTQTFTTAQVEAVENIKAGKERHEEQLQGWERHERRTGRRYEGWSGRNR